MSLLEVPPINHEAQWKLHSLLHCENKLRPKLELYSAAALISVLGKHFEVNTHVANNQADDYLSRFCRSFSNVEYLSPIGYFDITGEDVTHKMWKEKRLPNLAFVLVDADIPLSHLHDSFQPDDVFNFRYYLRLSQTHKVMTTTQSMTMGVYTMTVLPISVTAPRSTYTVLRGSIPFTPICHPIGGGNSASLPAGNTALPTQVKQDSQDSLDLTDVLSGNPKMAKMMQMNKKSSIYSYHGPLSLFDSQYSFNSMTSNAAEFYKINSQSTNKLNVFEKDDNNTTMHKAEERILFESFVQEFKKHYVGEDSAELRRFILSSTTTALTSIRAST